MCEAMFLRGHGEEGEADSNQSKNCTAVNLINQSFNVVWQLSYSAVYVYIILPFYQEYYNIHLHVIL